jgi:cyclomaltodextrinase
MTKSSILCFAVIFLFIVTRKNAEELFYTVPDWSREAIWYQIFPERFWNGDTVNDPDLDDMIGAWPYFPPENWQIHPWRSDWYKLQLWEHTNKKDFYWHAGLRRYGGDLQGVLERLDYLEDLGINAIYFNPLFESPSHHKYDTGMYHHIDNNFGPDPSKDREIWNTETPADPSTWRWSTADRLFLKVLEECHRRGIKVIIDGVFNHVGYTFWAFQDVLKNQEKSPFRDWFIIQQWDNPATPESEFVYQGWNGVMDLPEIKENESGPVEGPRQHIHDIVKRWMDPNGDGDPSDGIDGWRLDVAEKMQMNFWRAFRQWVKEINPEAYLTGEIWWEDWLHNKMYNAAPWLQEDMFDAVMNYRWGRAIKKFVIDIENKISPTAFADSMQAIRNDYLEQNYYVLQNLIDSHDMERLASQIVNPDRWMDHDGNPAQNIQFKVRKPDNLERTKQKLVAGIQMTYPGAPMIYYGDEAGMWGGDDPDCRKPMIWPELAYEPEMSHPYGLPRPVDEVQFEDEIFDWYKKLIQIRKENKILSRGSINFFYKNDLNGILGYSREYKQKFILILLNSSDRPRSQRIELNDFSLEKQSLKDLISDGIYVTNNGMLNLKFTPFQIYILQVIG